MSYGGSANGQFAELMIVPERDFAIVSLANAGPDRIQFNQATLRWELGNYFGVIDGDPEPLPYDGTRTREVVGRYDVDAMTLLFKPDGANLTLAARFKPRVRAAAASELPPDYPPAGVGSLPGVTDEYIIVTGGLQGQRGFSIRDEAGTIVGADLTGRIYSRTFPPSP